MASNTTSHSTHNSNNTNNKWTRCGNRTRLGRGHRFTSSCSFILTWCSRSRQLKVIRIGYPSRSLSVVHRSTSVSIVRRRFHSRGPTWWSWHESSTPRSIRSRRSLIRSCFNIGIYSRTILRFWMLLGMCSRSLRQAHQFQKRWLINRSNRSPSRPKSSQLLYQKSSLRTYPLRRSQRR